MAALFSWILCFTISVVYWFFLFDFAFVSIMHMHIFEAIKPTICLSVLLGSAPVMKPGPLVHVLSSSVKHSCRFLLAELYRECFALSVITFPK